MSNKLDKVFEEYFVENQGLPFEYKGKTIKISHNILLHPDNKWIIIDNLITNSKWKQGVVLYILNGEMRLNGVKSNSFIIWEDNFLNELVEIEILSGESVTLYNVWDSGNGKIDYGHNGAGIHVEFLQSKYRFNCNDGFPDDDLNDLIFDCSIK